MIGRLLDVLRCPICAGQLSQRSASLQCDAGHTFDIARQGYVNLLGGGRLPGTADTAEMVRARAEFLAAGHYAALADVLADAAGAQVSSDASTPDSDVVLDAGAGTGYYLASVLDRLPAARGLAVDVSKFAIQRAAQAHARISAVVWDTWQPLPLRDASVALVLNVFAPRNGPEFARVLRPGGALVVVAPTPRHLADLVDTLGLLTVNERKDERLERSLSGYFECERTDELAIPLTLATDDVERLVGMGPSAWHVDPEELRHRLADLHAPVAATASVRISLYRRQRRRP